MEKLWTAFKLILRNMEELGGTWRYMEGNRGIWRNMEGLGGTWRNMEGNRGMWRNVEEMDGKEHIKE